MELFTSLKSLLTVSPHLATVPLQSSCMGGGTRTPIEKLLTVLETAALPIMLHPYVVVVVLRLQSITRFPAAQAFVLLLVFVVLRI